MYQFKRRPGPKLGCEVAQRPTIEVKIDDEQLFRSEKTAGHSSSSSKPGPSENIQNHLDTNVRANTWKDRESY